MSRTRDNHATIDFVASVVHTFFFNLAVCFRARLVEVTLPSSWPYRSFIFFSFIYFFFFCPLFLCDPTKYLVVAGYRSHALQCTTLQVRQTYTCTALHLHELRPAVCTVTCIFTCNTWAKHASSLCVDNNRNRSQIFLESRLNHVTMFGWRDRRGAAICLSTSVYMFQIISDGFSTLCLKPALKFLG